MQKRIHSDVITQKELAGILECKTFINRQMLNIRRRIEKGATVAKGELGARITGDDEDPECGGYDNFGLYIDAAAETDGYSAIERRRAKVLVIRGGNLEVAHA